MREKEGERGGKRAAEGGTGTDTDSERDRETERGRERKRERQREREPKSRKSGCNRLETLAIEKVLDSLKSMVNMA